MLSRLKKNQVSLSLPPPSPSSHSLKIRFDAYMNGMEETYFAVKHEWEEVTLFLLCALDFPLQCRLMRRNLDSGLSRAELVYQECVERVKILRHERKLMLEKRKEELKNAHRLKRWLRERAVTKMALATELRGDLTKEEELLLRTQVSSLPPLP
jgi:hypothetical protein